MKAIYYEKFGERPTIENVPDPRPGDDSVTIEVRASGLCLSDWHGWRGHDPDIRLPHVPGHELSGEIVECGKNIRRWKINQRVTVPFVGGCSKCRTCREGNPQVCPDQFQPGFTHWGSFARYVEIRYADFNLVELPASMQFEEAASLGCRFTTAYRAIVDQAKLKGGEWLAVHGCGGVGLSAIAIASVIGARVIAIDPKKSALALAGTMGAEHCLQLTDGHAITERITSLTNGGVHVSIDAYGSSPSCLNAIGSLRRRGRHVQVGLINDLPTPIPMSRVIAEELEIMGSHGIQATRFPQIFEFVRDGKIELSSFISERCNLEKAIDHLVNLDSKSQGGITMITDFD